MKRIIVGMSGASGQIYGIRTLEILKNVDDVETHLIISPIAKKIIEHETSYSVEEVESLADYVYDASDVGARIASGSFRCHGMVVIPCSIKTASSIAYSLANNLITRAADVILKQRQTLVVVVRETPLHTGHLKILTRLSEIGAVVLPPIPAFYNKPKSVEDIVDHTVGRVLDFFKIKHKLYDPWQGIYEETKSDGVSKNNLLK